MSRIYSNIHKNQSDLGHLSTVKKVKLSSKYSNIFVRFLRTFEYIRDIKIEYLYLNIRYSAENIEIYSNIRHALFSLFLF